MSDPRPHGLRAALDLEAVRGFAAGQSCLLRVRVDSDLLAARALTLAASLSGDALGEATCDVLMPGTSATLVVPFVPRLGGQHSLSLTLAATFDSGRVTLGVSLHVKIGAGGPSVHIVNIDQSSARVVDNSRSTFGAPEVGGVLSADWQPLALEVLRTDATPPRSAPGRVAFTVQTGLGRYEATGVHAHGDLATVFSTTGDVVLKIADDRADNDLLLNEAKTLELLHAGDSATRRHLPTLRDRFRTDDGRVGLAFTRLDGLDLLALRARAGGALPPRHLVWVLRRCLGVLAYAHARGVLHGNLDPSHVMVRAQDHMVWLVDWAYAIVNPAQTGDRFKALNEEMSPPEVVERKPPLPASDLYALGKTMFFLAGGDPRAKTLPPMDERLERFLRFMVVESPRGRAQDAYELYLELDRVRERIWGPHTFVPLEI